MADCKNCGGCNGCSGCGKALELSQGEIDLLQALGQFSFLPVARKADDMTPVYKEEQIYTTEEYSLFIQLLEKNPAKCEPYRSCRPCGSNKFFSS